MVRNLATIVMLASLTLFMAVPSGQLASAQILPGPTLLPAPTNLSATAASISEVDAAVAERLVGAGRSVGPGRIWALASCPEGTAMKRVSDASITMVARFLTMDDSGFRR